MRTSILILSILAVVISTIWVVKIPNDYEPKITLIAGLIGLISLYFTSNKDEKEKTSHNENFNNQLLNFNFNLGKQPIDPNIVSETIQEPKENEKKAIIDRENIIELMKNSVKILFIDDDTNFNVVKILKNSGWKNTKTVVDIDGIDIPKVKEADIYFVDINGVGKNLNCKDEGLDLALMLKQKFPNKKVIIYSADNKSNVFHKAWDICDFKLEKNALPYQFQSLVEKYSLEFYQTRNS